MEELRQKLWSQMLDLSQFMKLLKQRFSQWFNRVHDREGTLWEGRFRSTLVEGNSPALATVAAYIDLNPVRAGLVDDPKDYRWCGYAEAVASDTSVRKSKQAITTASQGWWTKTMFSRNANGRSSAPSFTNTPCSAGSRSSPGASSPTTSTSLLRCLRSRMSPHQWRN